MNLSEEEYKNIWLRVKENLENWINKRLIFWFTIFSILVGLGVHSYIGNYINNALEKKVNNILDSKDFSTKLISSTLDKLENIKNKEMTINKEIDILENKIEKISSITSNIPFSIDEHRITFISKDNLLFSVEKGDCTNSSTTTFSKKFSNIPIVIISECPNGIMTKNSRHFDIIDVSETTFKVNTVGVLGKYSWIAIGN